MLGMGEQKMENLNAEQIKKVLEHCVNWTAEIGCKGCPYEENCIDQDVMKDALALINSQEQRIKELTEELVKCYTDKAKLSEENAYIKHIELEAMRSEANYYKMHSTELAEENERLQKALNTDISIVRVSRGSGKTAHLREVGRIRADAIRADAVRKMQHKIWLEFSDCTEEEKITVGSFRASIDQIAKEMLEDKPCT